MDRFGVIYSLEETKGLKSYIDITNVSITTVQGYCPYKVSKVTVGNNMHTFMVKVLALEQSPFEITLLLDGDTIVVDNTILDYDFVNELLGNKEYAVAPYNAQDQGKAFAKRFASEQKVFPVLEKYANTGVIFIRKSGIQKLCTLWKEKYLELSDANGTRMLDEASFNVVIQYELQDQTLWLPKPYNIRALSPQTKIYHAFGYKHDEKMSEMLRATNTINSVRNVSSILKKHNTQKKDLPHIKTIDFTSAQKPSLILYEYKHLSEEDQHACRTLLKDNGYYLFVEGGDVLATLDKTDLELPDIQPLSL